MPDATSFSVRTSSPARAARELGAALARVPRASGALLFVSGRMAEDTLELAEELSGAARGTPLLIATGAGVLSDAGEIEREDAVSGIAWSGGQSELLALPASSADDAGESLARALADRGARSAPTALVFARPEGFSPGALEPLAQCRAAGTLLGAGTVAADPVIIAADGRIQCGRVAALLLRGLARPVVRASPACRLLMPLTTITETRGSLVTRIGAEPALDVLSSVGEDLEGQPLVFAALAEEPGPEEARPELVLRAVQGVDPVRRGLLISDEVREGMRLAFAVRDPASARADLEATAREVARAAAGAQPRFALYLSCAGRGASLYGQPDVDTKILSSRFPALPFAGLHSSFEIAPHSGRPTLQLFTGVVALFSAPS